MNNFYIETRKTLITLLLIVLTFSGFSQTAPSNLSGESLRTWLKQNYFTSKHNTLGYNTARRYMYNYIDNKNNKVTCVYSGFQQNWSYGGTGTNPAPINCEHTVPQSFFNKSEPMRSDLHHLYPAYGTWNSTRSNHPFDEITDSQTEKWMLSSQSQTTIPSNNIDSYSEYSNSTFEPREDHKGNVARAIFYFYTMYPTQAGSITKVANPNTLYQWHLADPVDANEIARNNAIQQYQGDRNPYIVHPEYIARAWGFTPQPTTPSTPVLQLATTTTNITISWNDLSNEEGYKLYRSTNGTNYTKISDIQANTTSYTDASVNNGTTYYYYAIAFNTNGNSQQSNIVNGQTGTQNETITDLIFSEYVEGSSNNKALEIANFTGTTVDLSNYSIKKQTNGAGSWGSELALSGTLANGNVYVIVNASAGTTLKNKANLTTSSTAISFNGNDPVALFKNGTLVDVIGTFNGGSSSFAADKTLKRLSSINKPNSTYTTSEWEVLAKDNFNGIGSHTIESGNNNADETAPTTPTNLTASNIQTNSATISWTASTDNVAVTAYEIFVNGSSKTSVSTTAYNLSNLNSNTEYNITIKAKDEAGNISTTSNALTFNTKQIVLNYCGTSGQDASYEWIDLVQLGTINNTTGSNGGYADFTSQSTDLVQGSSNRISFSTGFKSSSYTEYWSVWIDYNQDGDFSDAGEQVATGSSSSSEALYRDFTVPSSAITGNTRMRVTMKYDATPSPCESFNYGEVEDYTVNITTPKLAKTLASKITSLGEELGNETSKGFAIFPNPTNDIVNVLLPNGTENISIKVISPDGSIVKTSKTSRINISNLSSGLYILLIHDGQKQIQRRIIKK